MILLKKRLKDKIHHNTTVYVTVKFFAFLFKTDVIHLLKD